MVLSSWRTMKMTTHTMWVFHAHTPKYSCDSSQLLPTLSLFFSLHSHSSPLVTYTPHTHTDKPHNNQAPLSHLLLWLYVQVPYMKISPVNYASPSTVITHQHKLFCLLFMIIAAILIKRYDTERHWDYFNNSPKWQNPHITSSDYIIVIITEGIEPITWIIIK